METTRPITVCLLAAALVAPPLLSRQASAVSVLVLSPSDSDDRIALVLEAIEFWNQSFAELDLEPVLTATKVEVSSPTSRALENYSRRIAQLAGRIVPGPSGPAPPKELIALDRDIVVLLSKQTLMSFAWPLPQAGLHFVAITAVDPAAPKPHFIRNVIAHELGHALGLVHHDDPMALMCLPCETTSVHSPQENEREFLPLTQRDRDRLRKRYSGRGH